MKIIGTLKNSSRVLPGRNQPPASPASAATSGPAAHPLDRHPQGWQQARDQRQGDVLDGTFRGRQQEDAQRPSAKNSGHKSKRPPRYSQSMVAAMPALTWWPSRIRPLSSTRKIAARRNIGFASRSSQSPDTSFNAQPTILSPATCFTGALPYTTSHLPTSHTSRLGASAEATGLAHGGRFAADFGKHSTAEASTWHLDPCVLGSRLLVSPPGVSNPSSSTSMPVNVGLFPLAPKRYYLRSVLSRLLVKTYFA